ncbi:MAG: UDP-N-acetylmuramoyl-L-alanyl-D-glutamate--2,6-diaminopimelate ligase [Christensenellaceae bacterium]|jgi:UDP-N-acetylmuramoyl-L-alanyl-D-glutamate--2,6-diaminopimelate ligase|nr:UDP-N-acetylmuramoyl-L-alanyl-D-glutamate--2,6-diaminopimelate ligase [Christensenellaceae bacterium]
MMMLSKLAEPTAHRLIGADIEIGELQYNSRKVQSGDVFCCIVGTFADGHAYAGQAIQSGAAALVVERELPFDVPQILVENTRVAMAEMAAGLYGYPSRELTIIGVTGTNGKTSTTYMLKAIAERMGKKVGLIGTIRNMIGDIIIDTERTTPESVDLQRIFRQMRDENVDVAIMEVSSHSLEQKRVHGIEFDVGLFTNLTQDHLDYHKTFANYLAAKKQLFYQSKRAVINIDDSHAADLMQGIELPTMTFGVREPADITATEIDITTRGVQFDLNYKNITSRMHIPIPGLFSVFNAMGAAGVALSLGWTLDSIKGGLENMMSVSGRLEPLPTGKNEFTVLLDYAHTPDALENVLKTIRGFAGGRVITLFGCGGDRDRAKRPIMGEIAGRFSDFLVVTSDNPRSEEPLSIIDAIEEGVKKSGCEYIVIENRRDAIRYALECARKNDIILLAGKGHENYQEINGDKHRFDEKEIVAELLGLS